MVETTHNSSKNAYQTKRYDQAAATPPRSWAQKMSNHIAYALLTYTGLQIFVGMAAIKGESRSILPYFALILLVAMVIPACRNFERRWERLGDNLDSAMSGLFRRDALLLWIAAIASPFLIALIANAAHAML